MLIWGGTWALALSLYGPVLISQLVMLPDSVRSIWDLRALYGPTPFQALTDMIGQYSQLVIGVPIGSGLGASPARYGTFFLGAIGLPLLALGIVGGRRDRRGWFLLALLVLIPVWDLVGVLLAPIEQQLSFLKSFQVARIRHLFPFVVVVNAAFGADILSRTSWPGGPWSSPAVGDGPSSARALSRRASPSSSPSARSWSDVVR